MYAGNQVIMSIQQDCDSVAAKVASAFRSAGYFVIKSFDLHSAMNTHSNCVCAKDTCSCQMVVLLVYAFEGPPATLIFDTDKIQTTIYLDSSLTKTAHREWTDRLTYLLPKTLFSVDSLISSKE